MATPKVNDAVTFKQGNTQHGQIVEIKDGNAVVEYMILAGSWRTVERTSFRITDLVALEAEYWMVRQ